MELKLLQEFMYLSKDLNFTKTAERCYVSQSVLSRHIQALEAELGCELLIRDKRGLQLTPFGEAFAKSCKRIDVEYAKALSEIDNIKGGFTQMLRIAYISPMPFGFIDTVYELQLERHPEVKLDLMASWEERAMVLLNQDKVDLSIFLTFEEPDPDVFSSLVLFEDHYVILVPADHALADKQGLTFEDLKGETLLIPSTRDFPNQNAHIMTALGPHPDITVRAPLNSKHDAIALANAHRGISMVRSQVVRRLDMPTLRIIPVTEPGLTFDMRAVWKTASLTPSLEDFISILEEVKGSGEFRPEGVSA